MDVSQPTDRAESRAALAILLDRPGLSAGELDEHISALVRYADRRGLSLDACLVARDRGRMVSACLCIDSPGRVSSVFIPMLERYLRPSDAIRGLLNESARLAGQRRVQMMQAMVSPDAALEAGVYRESGFDWLAELIYMDCDTSRPIRLPNGLPELRWVSYGSGTHELFSRVVEGTYVGSLDCVALSGVRAIEDILARGRIPLLTGGTMLYFRALERGLSQLPQADPEIRARLEAEAQERGWPALHARLAEVDPEAAQRIHANDPQRIQRALEVYALTGEPLSDLLKREGGEPFPYPLAKWVIAPRDRACRAEARLCSG